MASSYDSPPSFIRFMLIVGLLVSAINLYNLTKTLYNNYSVEKEIQSFEKKMEEGESLLSQNLEDFQYYSSDEYVEKMTKQNFNKLAPGEVLIVIPNDGLIHVSGSEEEAAVSAELRASWSNPHKWWEFVFGWNPYK